jgi:hypothetical protein
MQNVDRVAQVQPLAKPLRTRRPRPQMEAVRRVPDAHRLDRIEGKQRRRRHRGQRPPVGPAELEVAVGSARHLVALLVHRPVMAAAEEYEVRQRRGAARGPVLHVMALYNPGVAAREAARRVPMEQGAPERRRDRPRPRPDLHHLPVRPVRHHYPARVARQPPRRFL